MTGPEPETERSLLAELAADPDVNLQQIAPGVYWGGDDPGEVATGHEHRRPERPADWPSKQTPDQIVFDMHAEKASAAGLILVEPGVWRGDDDRSRCPFCLNDQRRGHGFGWNSGPM